MRVKKKSGVKILLIVIAALIILLIGIYINHQVCLKNEELLLTPMGQIVDVGGTGLSVYTEGNGEKTLLFMSGGGTCSPILEFRSLY